MKFDRRSCLVALGSGALSAAAEVDEAPHPFDPREWLKVRKQGRLVTTTPQSGKPLQALAAKSLEDWKAERKLYIEALWELIGCWPKERPALRCRETFREDCEHYTRRKVTFQSLPSSAEHASTITAWLLVPKSKPQPRPTIITLHQTLPQGKDEPVGIKASLPWMAHADYYARRGYVTLAPDAIGYGDRTSGGTAQTGFELSDAWPILNAHRQMTLLGLMIYDVTRCVDFLEQREDVDREHIGVVGHSQGGILVNFVLGIEPRLKVGVASCGYGLFRTDELFPQRWAANNSAYLPVLDLYAGDANALPLDFLQIMALAAPRAHLIQTARGDSIWTRPAVGQNRIVAAELRRVRTLYDDEAAGNFISLEPGDGALDKDHGWYPVVQEQADRLLARILHPSP